MNDDVNRLLQGSYPTEAAFMDSLYAYYRKIQFGRNTTALNSWKVYMK